MFKQMCHALLVGLMGLTLPAVGHAADPLLAPKGAIILTVDGVISNTNAPEGRAKWDLDMLKGLGVTTFTTRTPWIEDEPVFEGVLLRSVLQAVGASGTQITAYALDEYSNKISIQDFADYDVILAYAVNGKALDKDDKGPLWIMYPFDAHPGIDVEEKSAHAVWQLARITVQ